uniref:Uncharacterized protein n=1 Tax=Anguilla anguilla TaxID=7936 RepID=A0A0E9RSS3_ANGAN
MAIMKTLIRVGQLYALTHLQLLIPEQTQHNYDLSITKCKEIITFLWCISLQF